MSDKTFEKNIQTIGISNLIQICLEAYDIITAAIPNAYHSATCAYNKSSLEGSCDCWVKRAYALLNSAKADIIGPILSDNDTEPCEGDCRCPTKYHTAKNGDKLACTKMNCGCMELVRKKAIQDTEIVN